MDSKIFLFALCLLFFVASSFSVPSISETFSSDVHVQFKEGNSSRATGKGVVARDEKAQKAVEKIDFEGAHENDLLLLERYDMHEEYEVRDNRCHSRQTEKGQKLPEFWDWLKLAKFEGNGTINGKQVSYWGVHFGYADLKLAVLQSDPSTPVLLERNGQHREFLIEFSSFKTSTPDAKLFDVPSTCHKSENATTSVGCVARGTMISRAQVWVDHHVPYNQGGTYGGYREDCSGYVSMAWETSKPGYTTFTMHEIAHPISKGALSHGDALLCASEHVVLFGGWADGSHSHYIAFEETRPGEGTVRRVTPYPYWYNTGCFKPYRYDKVC